MSQSVRVFLLFAMLFVAFGGIGLANWFGELPRALQIMSGMVSATALTIAVFFRPPVFKTFGLAIAGAIVANMCCCGAAAGMLDGEGRTYFVDPVSSLFVGLCAEAAGLSLAQALICQKVFKGTSSAKMAGFFFASGSLGSVSGCRVMLTMSDASVSSKSALSAAVARSR